MVQPSGTKLHVLQSLALASLTDDGAPLYECSRVLYGADQREQSHRSKRNEADVRPFRPAGAADQRSVTVPEPSFLSRGARGIGGTKSRTPKNRDLFLRKTLRGRSDSDILTVSASVQNEDASDSQFRASGPTIRPERERLRAIMQSALPSSSSSPSESVRAPTRSNNSLRRATVDMRKRKK